MKFLFYPFYSEKKKIYYSIKQYLKDIEKILQIVKRRLKICDAKITDLDFGIIAWEERLINIFNKFGDLDFLGEHYKPMILKIVNKNKPNSYYKSESEYSEYHLNLIELNSYLTSTKPIYEKELKNLRNEITITWLFG